MESELRLPLGFLFIILFSVAGPLKMVPTFYGLSAKLSPAEARSLAWRSAALAWFGIVVAASLGTFQLGRVGVSREAVGTAAGLVLAIIGLMPLVGWHEKPAVMDGPPTAMTVAFPLLLPPYAVGIILLFSLYAKSIVDTAGILATGAGLMALNAVAMMFAGPIMRKIGVTPLQLLGAVLGIIQLAFGIQILFWGISRGLLAAA
jgi:multiple antibiotic resistance protein